MSELPNIGDTSVKSKSILDSLILRGLLYGFVAGLGLSIAYTLIGLIVIDFIKSGFPIFLLLLIFGFPAIFLLAIVPATLCGLFTGLILGSVCEILKKRIPKFAYVLLCVMICTGIAALCHIVFKIPMALSFESMPISFTHSNFSVGSGPIPFAPYDSYLFCIGFPTVIYILTGGLVGSILYSKRKKKRK